MMLSGTRFSFTTCFAVAMSLFHIAAASPFFLIPALRYRALHLLLGITLSVLILTDWKKISGKLYGCVILFAAYFSIGFMVINNYAVETRVTWTVAVTKIEIIITIVSVLVIFEMTRRLLGLAMVMISLTFITYGFYGPLLRKITFLRPLAHAGVSLDKIVDQIYFSYEGIFGISLATSADMVFIFVLFGALLQAIKGGELFVDLTQPIVRKSVGGPAKVAVLGSAFLGIVSGSAVANVVTSGTITIPMMRKFGYSKEVAGAIEAVSSCGGQIMPPVMGAGAFIMADMLGLSYGNVILRALFPAILYYLTVYSMVHWFSLKKNLRLDSSSSEKTISKKDSFFYVIKERGILLFPLAIILIALACGVPARIAGFYGVISAVIIPFFKKVTRVPVQSFWNGLAMGAKNSLSVILACACAGIIVGMIGITGLGFKFSSIMLALAGDSLPRVLILSMFAGFIFGLGLPTTAAYIIQASLVAPALIQMGVTPIAAHLFVFYYAVLGAITPPVAIASFTAAPLANADPYRVGWVGLWLGLPIYLIPFLFVYHKGILLLGSPAQIVYDLTVASFCIVMFSISLVGWWAGQELKIYERIALLVCVFASPFSFAYAFPFSCLFCLSLWLLKRRQNMRVAPM